jgi:hypothetical protein
MHGKTRELSTTAAACSPASPGRSSPAPPLLVVAGDSCRRISLSAHAEDATIMGCGIARGHGVQFHPSQS